MKDNAEPLHYNGEGSDVSVEPQKLKKKDEKKIVSEGNHTFHNELYLRIQFLKWLPPFL